MAIKNYQFYARIVGSEIDESFWQQAHDMNYLWNEMIEARREFLDEINAFVVALCAPFYNVKIYYPGFLVNLSLMTKERDAKIVELFEEGVSMPEIGERVGLTRQGVRYILNKYNRTGKERILARTAKRHQKLKELLDKDPLMSLKDLAKELGCHETVVVKDFDKLSIKRDTSAVLSLSVSRGSRKGRIELTRELLLQLYLKERKTRAQIAEITGYDASVIGAHLKKHKILKFRNNPDR